MILKISSWRLLKLYRIFNQQNELLATIKFGRGGRIYFIPKKALEFDDSPKLFLVYLKWSFGRVFSNPKRSYSIIRHHHTRFGSIAEFFNDEDELEKKIAILKFKHGCWRMYFIPTEAMSYENSANILLNFLKSRFLIDYEEFVDSVDFVSN